MGLDAMWTRRRFVTTAGLMGAATSLPSVAERRKAVRAGVWANGNTVSTARQAVQPYVLHLSDSVVRQTARHSIVTMNVDGERWSSSCPSGMEIRLAPNALAMHPGRPVVYVAHGEGMAGDGLRRAVVAAYAIDGTTGELRAMGTQPLALSALLARDLAVSPDGRSLLVAGSVGATYCVLPLAEDGSMGAVEHALKMTGGGPWRTLPYLRSVLFHPSGVAYGTDTPMDRLHVISFADDAPAVTERVPLQPECGPTEMALSPAGDALFVVTRWRPGFAMFPVDRATGRICGRAAEAGARGACGRRRGRERGR